MTDLDDAAMAVQVAQAGMQDYEEDDYLVTYFSRKALQRDNTVANLTAGLSLAVSLGFSLANCAESMTAAWLLVRFLGTPLTMTTLRDVMGLTGLAVIASNAGSPAWARRW